jgi:two-component system KDP operon response regulator KdpE
LLARIRVVIRRKASSGDSGKLDIVQFIMRDLTVDGSKHRVWLHDEEIHLTPNEYKLLALLIRHRGKVLTHRFLIENVWGGLVSEDTQSLRVCMGNLRRKLREDPIQPKYIITEIGVGYRLAD